MSWTRLDDRWTEWPIFEGIPHATRWHYLCLVQLCSRTDRLDGRLSSTAARRASDVEDPTKALAELVAAGLVLSEDHGFRLPFIADHVPPPSVRKNAEATRERMRRHRAHKAGDHSLCLPEHCPPAHRVTDAVTRNDVIAERVTNEVTRNTGTGQDGTGRDRQQGGGITEDPWSDGKSALPNCENCGGPMHPDLANAGRTRHPTNCKAA